MMRSGNPIETMTTWQYTECKRTGTSV